MRTVLYPEVAAGIAVRMSYPKMDPGLTNLQHRLVRSRPRGARCESPCCKWTRTHLMSRHAGVHGILEAESQARVR